MTRSPPVHLPLHLKGRYVEVLFKDRTITGTIVDITTKNVAIQDGGGRARPYEREYVTAVKKLDTYQGLKPWDLVEFTYIGKGPVTGYFGEENKGDDSIEVLSPNDTGEKELDWYFLNRVKNFKNLEKI